MHDYIDPAVGIPLAAVLWATWIIMVIRDRRKEKRDRES